MPGVTLGISSKPNEHVGCFLINDSHLADLMSPLVVVRLVDADGVSPEVPRVVLAPHGNQAISQALCDREMEPVAERDRRVLDIAPRVGDRFVRRGRGPIRCMETV